jgi:transposase
MTTQQFPTLNEHYATVLGIVLPWAITNIDLDIENESLTITISYNHKSGPCPECGQQCAVVDLREQRTWRHLDMMQFITTITSRPPRVQCAVHRIKTMATPWAGPRSHFSLLFERFAITVLQSTSSITKGTALLRISWHQAQLLMRRAVERGLARRDCNEVIEHVGIDEKSFLKGHRYVSLATDIDRGRVLDVERGRTKEAAKTLLHKAIPEERRTQVRAGAMDMWQPFMDAWTDIMGKEKPIVHDKFHVAGYLGKAVDEVRRMEHRRFKKDKVDTLTKTKYLWLKNPDNWLDTEREKFKELRVDQLKVGRAWTIKESFRRFWLYAREWSAKNFFTRWYFWATHSRLAPVIDVAKTLKRHLAGLLSYCKHPITNAATEGLNAKIQSIKANARGFRAFENYRVAILFHCGKLNMLP